jgi:hypothetical protein
MECPAKVCRAPSCLEERFNTSQHCIKHREQFVRLYKKYKQAQKPINIYITRPAGIADLNIEALLKVMSVCNKVVVMRKEYQIKAFKSELNSDRGSHKEFIERLIKLASVITRVLQDRFNTPMMNQSSQEEWFDSTIDLPEEWTVADIKVKASIVSFTKLEADLHKELDLLIFQKQVEINSIRSEIKHCYDSVNIFLIDKLVLNEKLSILACCVEYVDEMYRQAILEMVIEKDIIKDFKVLIPNCQKLDSVAVNLLRQIQSKTFCKLYLNKMSKSHDDLAELIYQGNYPAIVKKESFVYMMTAMLIDEVRAKGCKDPVNFNFKCSPVGDLPIVMLQ